MLNLSANKNGDYGKPIISVFDPEKYCDAIEMQIMSDEIITALWMIDNMPGWYRENPYPRALEIRSNLYKQLMTTQDYVMDISELDSSNAKQLTDDAFTFPRWDVARNWVRMANEQGFIPHIHELGPANYWLPLGLLREGFKFTYNASSIHVGSIHYQKELRDVWNSKPDTKTPVAFICFEMLEHMWNPDEIYHYFEKLDLKPHTIMLSTPCNTIYGGMDNWSTRTLGHLRTWTPSEFQDFASKFRGYNFTLLKHHSMVLEGRRVTT